MAWRQIKDRVVDSLRGKRAPATPDPEEAGGPSSERRVTRRLTLRLPVQVSVEGKKFTDGHTVDINLRGFKLDLLVGAGAGDSLAVAFEGIQGEVPRFTLLATAVRRTSTALGVRLDRDRSSPEALERYRAMVLHYLRNKPLLDKVGSGFFEAHCDSCGWRGRVGRRAPRCANCGAKVALPR